MTPTTAEQLNFDTMRSQAARSRGAGSVDFSRTAVMRTASVGDVAPAFHFALPASRLLLGGVGVRHAAHTRRANLVSTVHTAPQHHGGSHGASMPLHTKRPVRAGEGRCVGGLTRCGRRSRCQLRPLCRPTRCARTTPGLRRRVLLLCFLLDGSLHSRRAPKVYASC